MDPSYKHLISDMKIARIQKLRTRPSSSHLLGNTRDPKWMKLFHPMNQRRLKLKVSKLMPYSTQPPMRKMEIQPKFEVKTQSLKRILSLDQIEKDEKKIELALETIPEFSVFDEKFNVSRIGFDTSRTVRTSRPGTARPSTARTVRPSTAHTASKLSLIHDPSELNLLKKGPEFVSEVLKIWSKLENPSEDPRVQLTQIPEQELPTQSRPQNPNQNQPQVQVRPSTARVQISSSQKNLKIFDRPESFGMQVQAKMLSSRQIPRHKFPHLQSSTSSKVL